MAGIAVALIAGRRELVAALSGIVIGIALGLAFDPAIGIVGGGLFGPIVAMVAVRTPPAADDEPPLILIAASTDRCSDGLGTRAARAADGRGHLPVAGRAAAPAGDAAAARVVRDYLRLVGPAMLATLAAVNLAVVIERRRERSAHSISESSGWRWACALPSSSRGGACCSVWSARSYWSPWRASSQSLDGRQLVA